MVGVVGSNPIMTTIMLFDKQGIFKLSELIAYKCGDKVIDLQTMQELNTGIGNCEEIYFDNSSLALQIIRHSCAHLMAQAIRNLYTNAKFFVGPVVDDGFYYDFKVDEKITIEDLEKIEDEMIRLSKQSYSITKEYILKKEALNKFSKDELKLAVIGNIKDDNLSIYKQGDFEDLCRGPHIPNINLLKHFKLTKLAGAYLGGDENAEMLVRIYGIAFATKQALKDHLFMLDEAMKRDHRKLGKELNLYTFDEEIGPGLPIWLPKGARIRRNLEELLTKSLIKQGYESVRGPEILKSDLWKISGHYENYKENMYFTCVEDVEYGVKPMNCIGHIKVYQSDIRSYRDLPIRLYEYGVVHRHEKSGVLHGLLRVREFTQDDAHIFCTPEQIKTEIKSIIEFARDIMSLFKFNYEMEISTRPDKYIGSDELWDESTSALKDVLISNDIRFSIDEGGGAFYGPKIDIKITDAIGRKWQCGTIQIDMNLPERFKLEYIDDSNSPKRPVMIHRAILGSFERFIAILLEHFNGELPIFLSPTQVLIIPMGENELNYARMLKGRLNDYGVYTEINTKSDSLNKKIRLAEKQKIPFIIVIGQKELQCKTISIRDRLSKTQYNLGEEEFLIYIDKKMKERYF